MTKIPHLHARRGAAYALRAPEPPEYFVKQFEEMLPCGCQIV